MTSKWSILKIFRDHFKTLADARFDPPRVRLTDIAGFYLVPIAAGITLWMLGVEIRGMEAMLSGVSIYSALLFGLLVQVFQMKIRLTDKAPRNEDALEINRQLESNISYAVLFGILTTVTLLATIGSTEKDAPANSLASAIVVSLLIHLILTLFMILKRARAIFQHI